MATTGNGLHFPTDLDVPDVPYWNQTLAEDLDPLAKDTGWVDITTGWQSGWGPSSGATATHIRRIGRQVMIEGRLLSTTTQSVTNSYSTVVIGLASQFRPVGNNAYGMAVVGSPVGVAEIIVNPSGNLSVRSAGSTISATASTYFGIASMVWWV